VLNFVASDKLLTDNQKHLYNVEKLLFSQDLTIIVLLFKFNCSGIFSFTVASVLLMFILLTMNL